MSATPLVLDQGDTGQHTSTINDHLDTEQSTTGQTNKQPVFTGACFCGAIKFTLSSLPIKSYLCHCLDCRRITGTSFAHNILFSSSSVEISTSADGGGIKSPFQIPGLNRALSTFGDHQKGGLQFCNICGTKLFLFTGVNANGEIEHVIIPAGVIDESHEDERLRPTAEGYCKRREVWMPDMRETETFTEW